MPDLKITQLNADTAPTADDLIITVTDPGGSPLNKKVTLTNLFSHAQPIQIDYAAVTDQYIYGIQTNVYSYYEGTPSMAIAMFGQVYRDSPFDLGSMYGLYFSVSTVNSISPQKTITNMRGITGTATVAGDYTTVTSIYGLYSQVSTAYGMSSVDIGTAIGASVGIFLGSGDIDITEARSLEINTIKMGTITGILGTIYGIYIPDHSALGFTTHYNIYSLGAESRNYFEGKISQGSSPTGMGYNNWIREISTIITNPDTYPFGAFYPDTIQLQWDWSADADDSGRSFYISRIQPVIRMLRSGRTLDITSIYVSMVNSSAIQSAGTFHIGTWTDQFIATFNKSGSVTIDTLYGLYIGEHTQGTVSYNIYSVGATSVNAFEGQIQLYNVTGTNYERAYLRWNSNNFEIGTARNGTGTLRHIDMYSMNQLEFNRVSDNTPTGWVYTQGKWMQMECYPDTGQGCVGVNGDYFGIFTGNFITIDESASKVIGIQGLATAPTTQPTHLVQLWVADWGGDARLHILSETGDAIAIGNNRIWGMTTFTIGNADGNLTVDASMSLILEASDGDVYLNPIGGNVKFGTYTGAGAETFQGYITIKDSSGNLRKVMVCA